METTFTLGVAISILAHAAATIWWASRITHKVDHLERDVDQIKKNQVGIHDVRVHVEQSLARLEERTEAIIEMMRSLEKRIK